MYYLKSTKKDDGEVECLIVKCRDYALYEFQSWNDQKRCLYINIEIYILNFEKSIGQIREMLLASCHVDTAVFWKVLVTDVCFSSLLLPHLQIRVVSF